MNRRRHLPALNHLSEQAFLHCCDDLVEILYPEVQEPELMVVQSFQIHLAYFGRHNLKTEGSIRRQGFCKGGLGLCYPLPVCTLFLS